jgi:hypothetical protein
MGRAPFALDGKGDPLTGPTAPAGVESNAATELAVEIVWPFDVASADVIDRLPNWSDRK